MGCKASSRILELIDILNFKSSINAKGDALHKFLVEHDRSMFRNC